MMKRTVLYYPTISIPNGSWLRRALFYFDEIASIVPSTLYFSGELGPSLVPVSDEVLFLESAKVFRRIAPDNLWLRRSPSASQGEQHQYPINDWSQAHKFADEFIKTVDRLGFCPIPDGKTERLHRGKMADMILSRLYERGLVTPELDAHEYPTEWLLVEENTARLYMAMLAQFTADVDAEYTVPGTDNTEDENLIYEAKTDDGLPCIETRFFRAVPTPRDDVSLDDILSFKHRREAELLSYREHVDEVQSALSTAEQYAEVKRILLKFEENQRKALLNVTDAMKDANLGTFWGTLKTLVKASQPALWGAAAVAVAPHAPAASVALTGAALGATVEASAYRVDRRNEERANARKSAFSNVQYAREEHVL
jgi:hypothetical protein